MTDDERKAKNKKWDGKRWAHLSDEKKAQYERIEARIRERWERGEFNVG